MPASDRTTAKAKHIGIVAVSAEGAALCYRTLCAEGAARLGRYAHPEVSMHTFPLSFYMSAIEAGRWDDVGSLLLASAERVHQAGADFLICPDNTVHQAIDLIRDQSQIPWLHIAEEVADVAAANGFCRLLVLGTRFLMDGPVYPVSLGSRGIECEFPSPEVRAGMHSIIMEELVAGKFTETSRSLIREAIEDGERAGVDGVVLGCTELPLLISESDSPLPVLDSTRILARAALMEAVRPEAERQG